MSDDEFGASDDLGGTDQPLDEIDQRVLDSIAKLYTELDPVPDGLAESIVVAIALDSLDAELAQLQSQVLEPAGARGVESGQIQSLTFSSSSLVLLIKITRASPDRVRIDGWAAPGAQAVVELVQDGAVDQTVADQDGRFVFDDVPHAPTRFVVHPAEPGQARVVGTPNVTF